MWSSILSVSYLTFTIFMRLLCRTREERGDYVLTRPCGLQLVEGVWRCQVWQRQDVTTLSGREKGMDGYG